jgi:GNAT superfamily N-acetyltransferase
MSKPFYDLENGVAGVRVATKEDEGEIFALLLMLHAENGMFALNRDKVLEGIQCATERRGGIIYVIEEANRVVASLGMIVASDWYSDDKYLLERWNFVHPEYRRSDYARKLLEQAKWTHERFKAVGSLMPFQCGINSFDRTEAKIRLYARHLPCIGAFFMWGAPLRQTDKYTEELKQIEEANRRARRERSKRVHPVAEAIIHTSQR